MSLIIYHSLCYPCWPMWTAKSCSKHQQKRMLKKSLLRSLAVSWGCHPTYRLAHLKTKMRTLVYLVLRLRFQHSGLILTGHGIYTAVSPLRWSWWTGSPSSTKRTEIRLGTTWQVGAILSEGNGLPKLGGTIHELSLGCLRSIPSMAKPWGTSWMPRRCQIEVSTSRLPLVQTQKNYPTVVCMHRVACHARRLTGLWRLWRDRCIITVPELVEVEIWGEHGGAQYLDPHFCTMPTQWHQHFSSTPSLSIKMHLLLLHPLNQTWNLKSWFGRC